MPQQVRGDVFRAPEHLIMFSALFGTGCQLAVMVLIVILFAMAGPLHGDVYEERGEIVTTFIACYALTSFVSGWGLRTACSECALREDGVPLFFLASDLFYFFNSRPVSFYCFF